MCRNMECAGIWNVQRYEMCRDMDHGDVKVMGTVRNGCPFLCVYSRIITEYVRGAGSPRTDGGRGV